MNTDRMIKKRWIVLSIIVATAILLILFANPFKWERKTSLKPHFGSSENDYYLADPVAGHVHQPNAVREFNWAEHPSGTMVQKTNNLGLKKDEDTKVEKAKNVFRVLVTGDSHIDGVVYNAESFPNQLEQMLNVQANEEKTYECLNAAAGYYGPQNYLGALNKFKHLSPNMFIVTVYTGNDYLDAIRIESENNRLKVPERKDDYYYDLWEVDEKHPGFTGQLMNQVKFFKVFPQFKNETVMLTKNYLELIQQKCEEMGMDFLVVFLPTKVDIEPERDSARIEDVKRILKLSEEDLSLNQDLTNQLIDQLKLSKINYINLFDHWYNRDMEEIFWKKDYHINHRGHKRMAEIVHSNIF